MGYSLYRFTIRLVAFGAEQGLRAGLLDVLLGIVDAGTQTGNIVQDRDGRQTVKLRYLGKESTPTNSPTLYATDRDSYVVQGWIVTDAAILVRHTVPDDETLVEVPPALMKHLALDGLDGEVTNLVPPIVDVTPSGSYIIQGKRVIDAETLGHMSIPDHETCVHVAKSAVMSLLVGG